MDTPRPPIDILTFSRALACPVRLFLLQSMGHDGKTVADLASRAGVIPSTVCHHVRQLVEVGLAVRKRKGRTTLYRWSDVHLVLAVERTVG